MARILILLAVAAGLAAGSAVAGPAFPKRIDLPDGFQPEGIATAAQTFYVGSIPTGAVYRGDLGTGKGSVLVPSRDGRSAIGLKADRGRLFVAGGQTGMAYVYSATSGAPIAAYRLATGDTFVNDVVVTKSAAWFTDSFRPVLYRVPLGPGGRPGRPASVRTVPLRGDLTYEDGFNANGIAATTNGNTLVVVQSNTGRLFAVNASNGATREIDLGGETVPGGDGILLAGSVLYVVQNSSNLVAKIALRPGLSSGRIVKRITDAGLDVPTTVAGFGARLYAVNARFGTAASPTTEYWVTQLTK
jgi:DNA-binding beta-propeller fold protein YncE